LSVEIAFQLPLHFFRNVSAINLVLLFHHQRLRRRKKHLLLRRSSPGPPKLQKEKGKKRKIPPQKSAISQKLQEAEHDLPPCLKPFLLDPSQLSQNGTELWTFSLKCRNDTVLYETRITSDIRKAQRLENAWEKSGRSARDDPPHASDNGMREHFVLCCARASSNPNPGQFSTLWLLG
jgi:hypothetical protein